MLGPRVAAFRKLDKDGKNDFLPGLLPAMKTD